MGIALVWVQVPSSALVNEKRQDIMSCLFFVDRSGSKLEPKGSIFAPLRSAQSTRPPDEFRPIFRRYKIEILYHCKKAAAHIEATDASVEMIAEAKLDNQSAKLHFSVQDMFRLPYADKSFDVVIVSNALHIVPQPEKALAEIHRVLKERWRAHRADLHPRGELVFRQGQGIFHEAGGLPSPQQVDERGILALPAAKRLGGAEKRCSESLIPADLCRV